LLLKVSNGENIDKEKLIEIKELSEKFKEKELKMKTGELEKKIDVIDTKISNLLTIKEIDNELDKDKDPKLDEKPPEEEDEKPTEKDLTDIVKMFQKSDKIKSEAMKNLKLFRNKKTEE
jgi:hypothetical protein